jgi:methionyl-tRNA formyltransferase
VRLRAVLLMSAASAALTRHIAEMHGVNLDASVVADQAALQNACLGRPDLLLAFGTGVIVPQSILCMPDMLAINIHPASPAYPGRDPHHFACYDGVAQYGATMHHMTSRVDDGPILDVELLDATPGATPADLLALAESAGGSLLGRLFAKLGANAPLLHLGISWGVRKTTRNMFLEMCRVDASISKEEFERRLHATSMPGYSNLFLEVHGKRFRLEGEK